MPKIIIIGGIPESIVNFRADLIKKWCKLNYSVVAVAAPASEALVEKIEKTGALFRPIPLQRAGLNPFVDIKALFNIYKIIRNEEPDIVFTYTVKPVIYGSLTLCLNRDIKYFPMITGLGYTFAGHKLSNRLLNVIIVHLYRMALKRSELVFFQNKDDLELFRERKILPLNKRAVVTNGSGVNTEDFACRKTLRKQDLSFLLIGRLLISKGIREYIDAVRIVKKKYAQAQFILVGGLDESPDSVKQEELEAWQKEGIVKHYGWTEDVRPYLEECSVYVLPSYREGTPRSVLEAMAVGRAVITTDTPGCRETVGDGVNGFLVAVKDAEALAGAMEKFIREPELVAKMGAESRRIAEEKYDVHKVNAVINRAMGLI